MSGARRSADGDLHGNAPDDCPIALLIIDAINDFDYEEAEGVLAEARAMATRIRLLAFRARRAGVPIVYVNDNFGRWRSDFRRLVAHCARAGGRGRRVARALRPDPRDYFVLVCAPSGTGNAWARYEETYAASWSQPPGSLRAARASVLPTPKESTRSFLPMFERRGNAPALLATLPGRFRGKFHMGNLGIGFACSLDLDARKSVLSGKQREREGGSR